MKKAGLPLLIAALAIVSGNAVAKGKQNDFKTVTRVHYVQDCIKLNEGKMNIYEATHKCSCVIDELAKVFSEAEFEEANAGFRYKNLPGERGATFRDDKGVKSGIDLFHKTHIEAYESCRMRR